MFENRPTVLAVRGLMIAICLALVVGCKAEVTPAQPGANPNAPVDAPLPPTGLAATPGSGGVSLVWSASSGATSYAIMRSTTSGGPYSQIATAMSPSYIDTTTSSGTTYFYVVAAANSLGVSVVSAQAAVTPTAAPPAPPAPPAAPTSAPTSVSATAGNTQVSLTWSAPTGATSYRVKRATVSGGPYSQVGTPTSASHTDSQLTNGTVYYYVVSAVNQAGESANSAQVSATPAVPAPPPTTFGTWTNVTPAAVNLTSALGCGNFGAETIQSDPAHPSDLYVHFHCQGIWKSTDHGATWNGPINTGTNGATVGDCAGGLSIPRSSTASAPTIYQSCIRGAGIGFWRSLDGGVNWTRYFVAPSGAGRQDYYPPAVDPYDQNHLVMAGHEMNVLVESIDGGQNWTNVPTTGGMMQPGGTAAIFFINTGNASTTRGTWLWMAQHTGGVFGTWRTTNGGGTWTKVDNSEHPHGSGQIYQPDNGGVVYMAGAYSAHGWGVVRSTDYGQTWAHVGDVASQTVVLGTSKNVYTMNGGPIGIGGVMDPAFRVAAQPGTGTWTAPGTPAGLTQGPAQISVTNDGTHNILVGAMWAKGVWRYIEP